MNIAILGLGGVGGYFGAKICAAMNGRGPDHDDDRVFFVARGAHLEAIRARGLTVKTSSEGTLICKPAMATDDISALPPLDAALVCVKGYDLDALAGKLADRVQPGTEIVPLLNGVDAYDRLRARLAHGSIFPACVFIGTHIESPGVVAQQGGACSILYGRDPRRLDSQPARITKIFAASRIKNQWYDDVSPQIWTKFIFISAFGLVTACFNKTLGEVMADPQMSGRVRAVMGEIQAIARARGVALPPAIIEESFRKGSDFPPETKTSFQRDFEAREKLDERDLFGGTVVRLGAEAGIPTPAVLDLMDRLEKIKPAPPRTSK